MNLKWVRVFYFSLFISFGSADRKLALLKLKTKIILGKIAATVIFKPEILLVFFAKNPWEAISRWEGGGKKRTFFVPSKKA